MKYQVRVAGRIFEGTDINVLLKCAVEARKSKISEAGSNSGTKNMGPAWIGTGPSNAG